MTSPSLPPYAPAPGEPPFDEATRRPSGRRRLQKQPSPWRQWLLNPWLVVALLTVLACAGILIYLAQRDDGPARTDAGVPVVPITTTAQAAPPVTPSASADLPERQISGDVPADMPYIVGVNIREGRYSTAGALDPGTPGRWSTVRLRSKSGAYEPGADGSTASATEVVLRVGDIFYTQGYKPWTRIS